MTRVKVGKVGKASGRAMGTPEGRAMVPSCAAGAVTAAGTVGNALFVCPAGAHTHKRGYDKNMQRRTPHVTT